MVNRQTMITLVEGKPLQDSSAKTKQGFEITRESRSVLIHAVTSCRQVKEHWSSGFTSCQREMDLIFIDSNAVLLFKHGPLV